MDELTTQAIINADPRFDREFTLHPTTIAYIQYLLTPYAKAIEQAKDRENLEDIIHDIGPYSLFKFIREMLNNYKNHRVKKDKSFVIKILVTEIKGDAVSNNYFNYGDDSIMLPWDIQKGKYIYRELNKILTDPQTLKNNIPELLPVNINGYEHYLSLDYVAGLLLFSAISGQNFNITMFSVPFTNDYMLMQNRYGPYADYMTKKDQHGMKYEWQNYFVTIANNIYTFDSPDFMQGFATGAEWIGVDHHNYWSNLLQIMDNGDLVPITF